MRLRCKCMGGRDDEFELIVPEGFAVDSRVLLKRERNNGEVESALEDFMVCLLRI